MKMTYSKSLWRAKITTMTRELFLGFICFPIPTNLRHNRILNRSYFQNYYIPFLHLFFYHSHDCNVSKETENKWKSENDRHNVNIWLDIWQFDTQRCWLCLNCLLFNIIRYSFPHWAYNKVRKNKAHKKFLNNPIQKVWK